MPQMQIVSLSLRWPSYGVLHQHSTGHKVIHERVVTRFEDLPHVSYAQMIISLSLLTRDTFDGLHASLQASFAHWFG